MASRRLLLRAARLLEAEAKVMRDSCAGTEHEWVCGSCERDAKGRCREAQRDHDKMTSTAKALREAA